MAALVGVAGLMLKALGVLLVFLQLQATATHASQIASASGDPAVRMTQAQAFIRRQAPRAEGRVTGGGFGVLVELRQSEGLELLAWRPEIRVRASAMLLDSAEW